METKYIEAGHYKEMKKYRTLQIAKTEKKMNANTANPVVKKPWKKPVLTCGKKISQFNMQGLPPDDFS
jgi:hypothetical protein